MDTKERSIPEPQAMLSEWLKAANQFWAKAKSFKDEPPADADGEKEDVRSIHEAAGTVMRSLNALSTAMSDPLVMSAAYRGLAILPDVTTTMMKSAAQTFETFQKQLSEKAGKLGAGSEPYTFDTLDQDTLQAWSRLYEEEIQRYFNIPQLGLNRFYQERINKAVDKYNIFATSLTEFLQLLQLPFEKTAKVMYEKIEELTKSNKLPEDSREYYRMWVKTLEGHFMTLFQSSKYTEKLGNTMAALEDYLGARNSIIQDMLQSFPIPTAKEMNDLYKEVYLLKKRVRELEKANGKA